MPRQPVAGDRLQWADLSNEARAAIESRFGVVLDVKSAPPSLTPGIAARLDTETALVFLKAIPLRSPALAHYERERAINPLLPNHLGPRLVWSADAGGWLLLAFEHLVGQHVDLWPTSPHISLVVDTLTWLGSRLTPTPWADAPCITERVTALQEAVADEPGLGVCGQAIERLDLNELRGDTLAHWDVHEGNLLDVDGRIRVLDWSLACRAAAWVDTVRLVPRLITAGHSPSDAEATVQRTPAWRTAPAAVVTGLAGLLGAFALVMTNRGPTAFAHRRARTADSCTRWVQHRLQR